MCADICIDPPRQGREGPREAAEGGDGRQARQDQGCSRASCREADRQAERPARGYRGGEIRAPRRQLTKDSHTSIVNEDVFGKGSCIRSNRLGRCSVHISLNPTGSSREKILSHFIRGDTACIDGIENGINELRTNFMGFAFQTRLQQHVSSLVMLYSASFLAMSSSPLISVSSSHIQHTPCIGLA